MLVHCSVWNSLQWGWHKPTFREVKKLGGHPRAISTVFSGSIWFGMIDFQVTDFVCKWKRHLQIWDQLDPKTPLTPYPPPQFQLESIRPTYLRLNWKSFQYNCLNQIQSQQITLYIEIWYLEQYYLKTRPGDLVMPDPIGWLFNQNLDYFRPYKNQDEPSYKGHPMEFMVDFIDHLGPFRTIKDH